MKWLIRILFTLIAVVGLTFGALLLMPGDKLGSILADQVRKQTGRELSLSGDVRISFWPVLGMETGPVTFGNAPWASPQPMLSAESLAVGVDAEALLSGEVKIKRLIAANPVLRLELANGQGNWVFQSGDSDAAAASGAQTSSAGKADDRPITLEQLELSGARLIYTENGATVMDFVNVDLSASWPDVSAPLELQAEMAAPGGAVDVAMSIPDLPAFASGAATALNLELTAPGGQISFEGLVNLAGEMDGKTQINAADTDQMLAAFGQAGVSVPKGLGQIADIETQMTYTRDGRIALRGMVARLDQNQFNGDADFNIASPPQITARLNAGDLDLTMAGAATGGDNASDGGGAVATNGWSKDPIDASVLALANGNIRLDANSIAIPDLVFGKSSLTMTLDRSRAVLEMHPARLFSGVLNGQVVANNRNGLSVGGSFTAEGIDVKDALSTLAGIERLSGTGSGSMEFLGVGQNEDQIMRSLSGKGRIDMNGGVISGIDLDRLMGKGQGPGGTTVFNSLSASFKIKDGNLINKDLLMSLDNFRADGAGRVGFGARDIDYLFTPVALRANSGEGLAVPVRIVGPWSDPSIKPDLTKVLEAAADAELKKLEEEAKEKVQQKLSEELNATVTEDANIEDVIKDKLEDEAKKGLLKLLGVD